MGGDKGLIGKLLRGDKSPKVRPPASNNKAVLKHDQNRSQYLKPAPVT